MKTDFSDFRKTRPKTCNKISSESITIVRVFFIRPDQTIPTLSQRTNGSLLHPKGDPNTVSFTTLQTKQQCTLWSPSCQYYVGVQALSNENLGFHKNEETKCKDAGLSNKNLSFHTKISVHTKTKKRNVGV